MRTRQSARERNFNPIIRMAPPEPSTSKPSEGLLQKIKGSRSSRIEGYRPSSGWLEMKGPAEAWAWWPRIELQPGAVWEPALCILTAGMPWPIGDSTQGLQVFEEEEKGS